MFYYLKGRAAHLAPNLAVIDCGGVGYACRTTSYTLSGLQMGQEVTLYTHLNVREDAMELYGFGTEKERNCFQLLIGVSGVGPKAALSILLLELKDKLAKGQLPAGEERYGGTGVTVIPQNKSSEATAALAVLGYSPAEIAVALKGLDLEGLSLEELVRQALRKMIK